MKWDAQFTGRQVGAIGVFSKFNIEVEGDTRRQAELDIYKTHEHISELLLTVKDEFPFLHDTLGRYRIEDGEIVLADDCPWECYGCGHRQQALQEGFGTQCPLCSSYELHLTDRAKREGGRQLRKIAQNYRVVRDPLNGNRFQVKVRQRPDGVTWMWFDAGEACDTQAEADAKMKEFIEHPRIEDFGGHKAEPFDPRDNETGVSKCRFCSDNIRHLPAGQGWVHSDGHVVSFK